jgi:hypothetical protein
LIIVNCRLDDRSGLLGLLRQATDPAHKILELVTTGVERALELVNIHFEGADKLSDVERHADPLPCLSARAPS